VRSFSRWVLEWASVTVAFAPFQGRERRRASGVPTIRLLPMMVTCFPSRESSYSFRRRKIPRGVQGINSLDRKRLTCLGSWDEARRHLC